MKKKIIKPTPIKTLKLHELQERLVSSIHKDSPVIVTVNDPLGFAAKFSVREIRVTFGNAKKLDLVEIIL